MARSSTCPLVESVFNLMESLVPEYDMLGYVRERSGGALPGIAPSNTYPTADAGYIVIAGNSDPIFKRLMNAIGRPELGADPAFEHNDGRAAQSERLDAAIAAWTAQRSAADILAAHEAADVPAGRIYSVADIVADPHYQARGMLVQADLPGGATVKMPGIVPDALRDAGRDPLERACARRAYGLGAGRSWASSLRRSNACVVKARCNKRCQGMRVACPLVA